MSCCCPFVIHYSHCKYTVISPPMSEMEIQANDAKMGKHSLSES